MIRLIVFAVLGYVVYRFTHNWYIAVIAAVVLYVVYGIVVNAMSSSRNRSSTTSLLNQKMSEAEKTHFSQQAEHQQAMDAHKAQFDPELRKKSP
ncbi:MAG TPA: hypothetical protein VEJ41_00240 [Candidatus Acidoferrales bacterium]|nr:hypothetical protein [Candidatus Acidoferrales bacterium]